MRDPHCASGRRWRLLLALLVTLTSLATPPASVLAANAVKHRGIVFVSLPALLDDAFLDGHVELTHQGRTIDIRTPNGRVRFEEGGSQASRDEAPARPLLHPVLVLDEAHYVPAEECASLFGCAYEAGPSPALTFTDRRLNLDVETLDLPHFGTRVEDLRPVRRPMVLTRPLRARRHLHADVTSEQLPAGAALLVRREVRLDGVPHAIVTRNDEDLETYVVALDDLHTGGRASALEGTHLDAVFKRLAQRADDSAAIDHGPRERLPRTVALSVGMCWSLRAYEQDFFRFIPRLAPEGGQTWITVFMTGRWLQQHPEEMERLIRLSREPGVGVTWALHSWEHPKERPFMNRYPADAVRADNLRTEHDLLEWGIVPSIFYRFPGLVHDKTRLDAILGLDLISIDCDSWVASMRRQRPPHRLWPTHGSILLVHGNGNEPLGIARFYQWMIENPGYQLGKLSRFVSGVEKSDEPPPASRGERQAETRRNR